MEIQLEIAGVAVMPPFIDIDSLVFLKKAGAEKEEVFLIYTGRDLALAIAEGVRKKQLPRPSTHDLLKNCIEALGGSVQKVVIGEFKDGVSHSSICIDCGNNKTMSIDSRPVDALALAARAHCPICMEEEVFLKGAMKPPSEEEMKRQQLEQLSEFLKNVDPKKLPIQ
jgi:hypothetical protein